MNRKIAPSLVLFVAAAGSAFAEGPILDPAPFVPGMTRAQVQAEFHQFRQSGVNPWAKDYNPMAAFRGERSRADVTAEYIAERDTVTAMTGEDSGAAYLSAKREMQKPAESHLASLPKAD